jgi:hypothetical protein
MWEARVTVPVTLGLQSIIRKKQKKQKKQYPLPPRGTGQLRLML